MDAIGVLLALLCLAIGAAGGYLVGRQAARQQATADVAGMRTALEYERRSATERVELVEQSQRRLTETFEALSARALEGASRQFLQLASARFDEAGTRAQGDLEARRAAVESLVAPLRDTLTKMEDRLRELETARTEAYATLVEQVRSVREASDGLRTQTAQLVTALRKPQARGAWGELQLRRVVEVAGMLNRCDFTEQLTMTGDGAEATQRPDLVVHLVGGRSIVVDSKVPLSAFLEAAESTDEAVRAERLAAHARHVRTHVDQLSSKAYWRRLDSPEFVVLFIPAEAFLAPALDHDAGLLEYAAGRNVVIATPTTLIALLRTVAYAWTQEALTTRAKEVYDLGKELYNRLGTLGEHVDRLGTSLGRAVESYNATVGSLESRVLVQARRLAAMEFVEDELTSPRPVELGVRPVTAPELRIDAEVRPAAGLVLDSTDSPAAARASEPTVVELVSSVPAATVAGGADTVGADSASRSA
ncbi:DNA recombination protein RmuC [Frankia sp. AgB1.9]|uniref:DNA recombination protein RmuC n=1 Tax=unclassified Frankia TaxID=2632575 RepID=UPI0019335E30|nr:MULTISPECIES: DNA recombination protein RmuC [unclassified Frankia]MBL7488734.1 DNA recombination protein RmuC [Frankia sp. AgW1.1]MBL7549654.1 DNA recombination protein RmuC [Frankia sp. AgB1.9]MBL7623328.1 DNA recombination protein RmuC [Frankia sp. AgB1.8]